MITTEQKQALATEFGSSETNTGLSEVQIALFTERIKYLTQHLQFHKKDHHSRRGLFLLIGKRKKLLEYLKREKIERYRAVIAKLGIRK